MDGLVIFGTAVLLSPVLFYMWMENLFGVIYLYLKHRNTQFHRVYPEVIYWEKGDKIHTYNVNGGLGDPTYFLYSIEENGIWVNKTEFSRLRGDGEKVFVPLWHDITNLSYEKRKRSEQADRFKKDGSYQEFLYILKKEYESMDTL